MGADVGSSISSPIIHSNKSSPTRLLSGPPNHFSEYEGFSQAHLGGGFIFTGGGIGASSGGGGDPGGVSSSSSKSAAARQRKQQREKKNEVTIDVKTLPGYRGNDQVDNLLEFITGKPDVGNVAAAAKNDVASIKTDHVAVSVNETVSTVTSVESAAKDETTGVKQNSETQNKGAVSREIGDKSSAKRNRKNKGKSLGPEGSVSSKTSKEDSNERPNYVENDKTVDDRDAQSRPDEAVGKSKESGARSGRAVGATSSSSSESQPSKSVHRRNRSTGAVLSTSGGEAENSASSSGNKMTGKSNVFSAKSSADTIGPHHRRQDNFGGSASDLASSKSRTPDVSSGSTPSSSSTPPSTTPPSISDAVIMKTASSSDKR